MSTARLALRNTRRSWKRSVLTGLAIAIAVAAVTFFKAYLTGLFQSFHETTIQMETGHMKIMPREAVGRVRPLPLEKGVQQVGTLVEGVKAVPGVEQVSPRITFGVLLDKEKGAIPAMGFGHDMSRETRLMKMGTMVGEGRLPEDGQAEALVGEQLAAELGLGLGDELFVVASNSYGGLGPGLYEIVGLMRTGIPVLDRKRFHVPLEQIQDQLVMEDMAMDVAIAIEGGASAAEAMKPKLQAVLDSLGREDLAVLTWKEASIQAGIFDQSESMSGFLMLLIGIVALTTVVNTILMSVMERVREFGTLRALGFARLHIMRIVLVETVLIGLLGTLAGLGVGLGVASWLQVVGLDFSAYVSDMDMVFNPIIRPLPNVSVAVYAAFFGAMVSILAAWYPARVAVRVNPARALSRHD